MSPVAKKFLAASIIYFLLGLIAQTAAVFDVWLGFNPLAYTTVAVTTQLLLIGWLTQAALALIYGCWLTSTLHPGRNGKFSGIAFLLFNLGVPLVIIGQPGLTVFGGPWLGAVAAIGALLQLAAALFFSWEIWHLLGNGD